MLTLEQETEIRRRRHSNPKPVLGMPMTEDHYKFISQAWDDVTMLLSEIDRLRDLVIQNSKQKINAVLETYCECGKLATKQCLFTSNDICTTWLCSHCSHQHKVNAS